MNLAAIYRLQEMNGVSKATSTPESIRMSGRECFKFLFQLIPRISVTELRLGNHQEFV